jgi:hypothetical protein
MASLLANDTASARGAVADILGLALQTLGALGFGYGIAIYCDWRVALLVTALLPLLVSGGIIQTRCVLSTATAHGTSWYGVLQQHYGWHFACMALCMYTCTHKISIRYVHNRP